MSQQVTLRHAQGATLTPRQTQIVQFIQRFMGERGYFPRYEDIAAGVGLKSKSAVSRHMRALEAKGVLVRGDCPRATKLEVGHAG